MTLRDLRTNFLILTSEGLPDDAVISSIETTYKEVGEHFGIPVTKISKLDIEFTSEKKFGHLLIETADGETFVSTTEVYPRNGDDDDE